MKEQATDLQYNTVTVRFIGVWQPNAGLNIVLVKYRNSSTRTQKAYTCSSRNVLYKLLIMC